MTKTTINQYKTELLTQARAVDAEIQELNQKLQQAQANRFAVQGAIQAMDRLLAIPDDGQVAGEQSNQVEFPPANQPSKV